MDFDFPFTSQEGRKRRFNISHFFRKLPNGEKYKREWLVYSKTKDATFCFYCKLFSKKITEVSGEKGVSKWKNLNNRLNAHETSLDHLNCCMTWHDLIKRFKGSSTIDAVQQRQMDETTKHWRHVLERLFSIIKFHGSQNVALRGTSDKLYDGNNGYFLKIVELLAKFYPVMKEHIRRIKSKEIYSHYLGKNIQNEIIQILSKAVKEKIVVDLKASKYYSIIVDCSPDISHTEQMTIILRFVPILPTPDEKESYVDIREQFLSFMQVNSLCLNKTHIFYITNPAPYNQSC